MDESPRNAHAPKRRADSPTFSQRKRCAEKDETLTRFPSQKEFNPD